MEWLNWIEKWWLWNANRGTREVIIITQTCWLGST